MKWLNVFIDFKSHQRAVHACTDNPMHTTRKCDSDIKKIIINVGILQNYFLLNDDLKNKYSTLRAKH